MDILEYRKQLNQKDQEIAELKGINERLGKVIVVAAEKMKRKNNEIEKLAEQIYKINVKSMNNINQRESDEWCTAWDKYMAKID